MSNSKLILGVDGGGSSSQAALFSSSGEVVSYCEVGSLSCKSSTSDEVLMALRGLRKFLDDYLDDVASVVMGLSGLDSDLDYRFMTSLLEKADFFPPYSYETERTHLGLIIRSTMPFPIMLCSDAVLPLFANGYSEGTVVISGTGSVAWKIEADNAVRIGGWGYRISDEGSGYWIGSEFVRSTLHVADSLIGGHAVSMSDNVMLKDACDEIGVSETDPVGRAQAFIEWACAHENPKDLARMTKCAFACTSARATEVKKRAAYALAHIAFNACTESGIVVLAGGVFGNKRFTRQVEHKLRRLLPNKPLKVITNEQPITKGAFELAKTVF